MISPYQRSPFPYFGGKADAAPTIWDALGDVHHYVEPFCGSLITLLLRPHPANRTYYSETVNDIDGLLVNMWRAMQFDPEGLARVVSWPVTEVDLTARHLAIVRWAAERDVELMLANPKWYDVEIAGYWLYGICAWIGSGWCSNKGPWIVGADGRITRRSASNDTPGVERRRPHLSNNGMGVHRPHLREPGVTRQLPHLGNDGRGVHRPHLREPGVARKLPHLSDDGMGVHRPHLREPGVTRNLPHLGDNGKGVHRPQLREPGVIDEDWEWHPMTMPELLEWFKFLSARLRHVRITCGDWKRTVTNSVLKTLSVRTDRGIAGVFLDPPYSASERDTDLYLHDDDPIADEAKRKQHSIAAEVREWCLNHGDDPQVRIVLAGFAGEGHEILEKHGWRSIAWFREGLLKGGYGKQSDQGHQQHRERLWLSPHCLSKATSLRLWDDL